MWNKFSWNINNINSSIIFIKYINVHSSASLYWDMSSFANVNVWDITCWTRSVWMCFWTVMRYAIFICPSACVSDIYFSGVQVYPQRENGDFASAFWHREKSPFEQQKSPIYSGFSQETSYLSPHYGGEGGIRTLETLLRPTRFPIVRARPDYATSPWSRNKFIYVARI